MHSPHRPLPAPLERLHGRLIISVNAVRIPVAVRPLHLGAHRHPPRLPAERQANERSISKVVERHLACSSVRCAEQPSLLFQEALLRWVLQGTKCMPAALVQNWEHTMDLTIMHRGPMFGQGNLAERWSGCSRRILGTLASPLQVHAMLNVMRSVEQTGACSGVAIVLDEAWPKPMLRSGWSVTGAFQATTTPNTK